jgi:hypothetical protein
MQMSKPSYSTSKIKIEHTNRKNSTHNHRLHMLEILKAFMMLYRDLVSVKPIHLASSQTPCYLLNTPNSLKNHIQKYQSFHLSHSFFQALGHLTTSAPRVRFVHGGNLSAHLRPFHFPFTSQTLPFLLGQLFFPLEQLINKAEMRLDDDIEAASTHKATEVL